MPSVVSRGDSPGGGTYDTSYKSVDMSKIVYMKCSL